MRFPVTGQPRGIPVEISEQIFLHASPWELLQLQLTCRTFHKILEKQSIWRLARRSLVPPVPDPVLPQELFGYDRNWSEQAYARFIFGQTVCTFCGDVVPFEQMSASFSLRERACVYKKNCLRRQIDERIPFPAIGDDTPLWMRLLRWNQPFAETSMQFAPLYNYKQLRKTCLEMRGEWALFEALEDGSSWRSDFGATDQYLRLDDHINRKEAWLGPFMQTANALVLWHKNFRVGVMEHSDVRKRNFELAKELAKSDRVRFVAMVRSDSLKRCLLAHSRSQTHLTMSTWYSIRSHVLQEIANEKAGINKFPLPQGWAMKVICPYCSEKSKSRAFMGGVALTEHVRVVHPDLRDVVVMKSVPLPHIIMG